MLLKIHQAMYKTSFLHKKSFIFLIFLKNKILIFYCVLSLELEEAARHTDLERQNNG